MASRWNVENRSNGSQIGPLRKGIGEGDVVVTKISWSKKDHKVKVGLGAEVGEISSASLQIAEHRLYILTGPSKMRNSSTFDWTHTVLLAWEEFLRKSDRDHQLLKEDQGHSWSVAKMLDTFFHE